MAVRKAIGVGRIRVGPDNLIDVAEADQAWAISTDPSKLASNSFADASGPAAPGTKPVPAEAIETVAAALKSVGHETQDGVAQKGMTFVQARVANEILKAQRQELLLRRLKGELVDRAKALDAIFALARAERDTWTQWPARVAALIAAELQVDTHKTEQVLDVHVRKHLEGLAELAIELK
jgi:hypothetical protein